MIIAKPYNRATKWRGILSTSSSSKSPTLTSSRWHPPRNPTKNCRLLVQIFSNISAEVLAKERYVWPNCMTPSVENISWISCWQDRTGFKIIQILHGALAYHLATDKRQSLPPHQENWCAMSPLALFTKARISFATTQSFHTNHATQISFQITLCAQHLVAQHVCSIVALHRLALRMTTHFAAICLGCERSHCSLGTFLQSLGHEWHRRRPSYDICHPQAVLLSWPSNMSNTGDAGTHRPLAWRSAWRYRGEQAFISTDGSRIWIRKSKRKPRTAIDS